MLKYLAIFLLLPSLSYGGDTEIEQVECGNEDNAIYGIYEEDQLDVSVIEDERLFSNDQYIYNLKNCSDSWITEEDSNT